jgi:hypothetical protein
MKVLRVVLALLLTLVILVTSRYFGPNRRYQVEAAGTGYSLHHKAPRGHDGPGPAEIVLGIRYAEEQAGPPKAWLLGQVKGEQAWQRIAPSPQEKHLEEFDQTLVFEIPHHPPMTRYFYRFEAQRGEEPKVLLARENGEPMMVKFKGIVPSWIWIPHVLAMFGGFFLLILSAFHALTLARDRYDGGAAKRWAWGAWIALFLGGVPIGIAMNHYAFGVLWEAFPFGGDVTDNKTQVALLLWGIAALALTFRKGKRSGVMAVIAAVLVLGIFLIPHSL